MPDSSYKRPHKQLQPLGPAVFDLVGDVSITLQQLDYGSFSLAARMVSGFTRDDRYLAVLRTRVDALETVPLDVHPADDSAKARKIADELGGVDDGPGMWDQLCPGPEVGELNSWGILIGIGIAEIIWSTDTGKWVPRIKPWDPQALRWDWASHTYKLLTAEGEIELPKLGEEPHSDGRWLIWCPYGYESAFRKGLAFALAMTLLGRSWARRDWSRHNELHGLGITKAIVPVEGDDASKQQFFEDVANRGSEMTVMVPQGADGNKYDVELVEAAAKTWDTFQGFKKESDDDIAILILGQNLTTNVQGGSRAAAQAHELVRRDKLKKDAGIAVALRDQLLWWYAKFNYGDGELAPRPTYDVEPPADQNAIAVTAKTAGDALAAMKTAGAPVNVRAFLESLGIPLLSEEEVAAEKAVAAEEAAAAPAPPLPPGGAPGGAGGVVPAPGGAPPFGGKQALGAAMPGSYHARTVAGLPVRIEHPAGSTRVWRDADANTIGATKMLHDYGYFEDHLGSDGEQLDVYVGGDENATDVHVVHQQAAPDFKAHDEDKVFMQFPDAAAAKESFLHHRGEPRAFGGMSTIPLDRFKARLQRRTGIGKIRAHALPDAVAAIKAMLALHRRATSLKGGARRRYTDDLTEKAIQLGARTLAVDLAALRVTIKKAESFPELLSRLTALYRDKMDPADFARVVQKVRLMGQLAGAASVHKEAHS